MIYIQHRVNLTTSLKSVPKNFGVEIDLRTSQKEIILSHDPYTEGVLFREWLESYDHELLVLNVKEDGLESSILKLLKRFNVNRYFFLDQAFPTLLKSLKSGISVAARLSEFENTNWALEINPEWLWLDSLTGNWKYLSQLVVREDLSSIKKCLVSPELHGRNHVEEIPVIAEMLKTLNLMPQAICTKNIETWEKFIHE